MRHLIIVLVVLMVVPSFCLAYAPGALTTTTVSGDMSSYVCGLGQSFNVTIRVADVTGLYAWQVKLLFDASVLNCTAAFYPPDHVFAGQSLITLTPVINNAQGSVLYGAVPYDYSVQDLQVQENCAQ
jgi:hypothetical protein